VFEVRSYDQMAEMARSGRLQGFIMAGEAFVLLRPRYDFLADFTRAPWPTSAASAGQSALCRSDSGARPSHPDFARR